MALHKVHKNGHGCYIFVRQELNVMEELHEKNK